MSGVALIRTPMTTVASGRCTSAPEFVESLKADTGHGRSHQRSRVMAACQAAPAAARPSLRRSSM